MSERALHLARAGRPEPLRRIVAMGSNVEAAEARLSRKIREAVRMWREYPGHGTETEAWLAIRTWERHTGRLWTGETPTRPAA